VLAGFDPAGRVAELAVGAGDYYRPDALVSVGGEDAPAGRLVVGVSVYRHQGERLCHTTSLPRLRVCSIPACFPAVLRRAGGVRFRPSCDGPVASGRCPHGERAGPHRYRERPVRRDDFPVHLAGEYRVSGDLHLARLKSFQLPVLLVAVGEDPGGYLWPAER